MPETAPPAIRQKRPDFYRSLHLFPQSLDARRLLVTGGSQGPACTTALRFRPRGRCTDSHASTRGTVGTETTARKPPRKPLPGAWTLKSDSNSLLYFSFSETPPGDTALGGNQTAGRVIFCAAETWEENRGCVHPNLGAYLDLYEPACSDRDHVAEAEMRQSVSSRTRSIGSKPGTSKWHFQGL